MKGYSCQCITHVGCCIKQKPRENIKVCVNVLPISYQQVTETFRAKPVSRLLANCQLTDNQLSADRRPTVGRQLADRFFGELFFTITD